MFVERQTMLCKKGRYHELQELLGEWSKEFKFPRANKIRHYFTYVGQEYRAFCFELEFESLNDLQKGWEEWDEMAEEMEPYLEKFKELVDEYMGTELWRVKHPQ